MGVVAFACGLPRRCREFIHPQDMRPDRHVVDGGDAECVKTAKDKAIASVQAAHRPAISGFPNMALLIRTRVRGRLPGDGMMSKAMDSAALDELAAMVSLSVKEGNKDKVAALLVMMRSAVMRQADLLPIEAPPALVFAA